LAEKLSGIRNAAAQKARAEATDRHQKLLERETAHLRLQIEELRRKRRR
jgi:hypothetical protein